MMCCRQVMLETDSRKRRDALSLTSVAPWDGDRCVEQPDRPWVVELEEQDEYLGVAASRNSSTWSDWSVEDVEEQPFDQSWAVGVCACCFQA
jgi:hypothetical protein